MGTLRWRVAGLVAACVVLAALTGASSEARAAAPAPVWTASVGEGPVAMPLVYDGRAFAVDDTLVTAVGLTRGRVVWQDDDDLDGLSPVLGLPSLVGGQVDVPWAWAEQKGVFVHDPDTGAVVDGPGSYVLGHIVTRGTHRASLDETFGGMSGMSLVSLDYGRFERVGFLALGNGEPLESYSDPVIVGDHVWVGYGGSLMRFDRRGRCVAIPQAPSSFCGPNGTADIIGNIVGLAAGPNGTIVATTDNGVLQVFDGTTGVELWRATVGPSVTAPAVRSGLITLGYSSGTARSGRLLAYPATGCGASECSPSWSVDVESAIVSAPSMGGGFVVVGSRNRKIVAVSISACAAGPCSAIPLGRVASPITGGPVVGDHMVIVGTASGELVGFREPSPRE